ncbi:MAG: hypothetical protein J6C46_09085 [Clostridia bacterium]|nr:hypothetical protein [Clostridia bacterium]
MNEEKDSLVRLIEKSLKTIWYRNKIQRYEKPYITLKEDEQKIMYCSVCWDKNKKLIQVDKRRNGVFICPNCKQNSYYDEELARATSVIKPSKEKSDFVKYNGYNR